MKTKLKHHGKVLDLGLFSGMSLFVLTFITCLYWLQDGFDMIEVSLLTIISGFYFLLIIPIANSIGLNKYIRKTLDAGKKPLKRIHLVLIVFGISLLTYVLLDSVFFLIDKSVSLEYADALKYLANTNNQPVEGMDSFTKIPFSIQNVIVTFILGLLGSFISLLFVKKNGKSIKTEESWR